MLEFLGGLLVDLVIPYRIQIAFWLVLLALFGAVCFFLWLGA